MRTETSSPATGVGAEALDDTRAAQDVARLAAQVSPRFPRHLFIAFTFVISALLVFLWMRRIMPIMASGRLPPDMAGLTTLQSQGVDLGIVDPLMFRITHCPSCSPFMGVRGQVVNGLNRTAGGFGRVLCHRSVWVRTAAALCVALVVFYGTWALSYAWLPEGSFRSTSALTGPRVAEGSGDALAPAMRIFLWNLGLAGGMVAAASLFAVGRFSGGYLVPLLWVALYGGLLRTNSFALPDPAGPMAPSLSVVWTRAGLRELAGYVLIASALADVHLWRQAGWWSGKVERVRRWREVRLPRGEIVCLAVAVVMVGWGAWVEGSEIALAGLP